MRLPVSHITQHGAPKSVVYLCEALSKLPSRCVGRREVHRHCSVPHGLFELRLQGGHEPRISSTKVQELFVVKVLTAFSSLREGVFQLFLSLQLLTACIAVQIRPLSNPRIAPPRPAHFLNAPLTTPTRSRDRNTAGHIRTFAPRRLRKFMTRILASVLTVESLPLTRLFAGKRAISSVASLLASMARARELLPTRSPAGDLGVGHVAGHRLANRVPPCTGLIHQGGAPGAVTKVTRRLAEMPAVQLTVARTSALRGGSSAGHRRGRAFAPTRTVNGLGRYN
mmetsp:Transcript_34505/g.68233  ORF Transcript_34505/g.68233 Transcript_34505/m.68233 type:complete len:282 (-) Transcript_34505:1266-2111(-)